MKRYVILNGVLSKGKIDMGIGNPDVEFVKLGNGDAKLVFVLGNPPAYQNDLTKEQENEIWSILPDTHARLVLEVLE